MKAILRAIASCSPIGRPHCTGAPHHSRAIFSAHSNT